VIDKKIIGWHQTVGKPLSYGFYFEAELSAIQYKVVLVKGCLSQELFRLGRWSPRGLGIHNIIYESNKREGVTGA